ncbi:unnamed protein product [Protopolystoma xenopodis]|uniref:Uncharacterized protein n=1 Tax=Protopolystoma xenopodis TaxID=117903 RepID=A0A3S5AGF8_9PLAT|nr:unnamed protein product [Protopolystoma xenopodis]
MVHTPHGVNFDSSTGKNARTLGHSGNIWTRREKVKKKTITKEDKSNGQEEGRAKMERALGLIASFRVNWGTEPSCLEVKAAAKASNWEDVNLIVQKVAFP